MATGLVTLGDDDVDPGGDLALGVLALAHEAGDELALGVAAFDHELRRRAEGVGDEPDTGTGQSDVEQGLGALVRPRQQAGTAAHHRDLVVGDRGDAVALEDAVDEPLVLLGDHLAELGGVEAALLDADVLGRHQEVDAVGLAADVLVDPVELDLELLWRERDGAQHAEAPDLRHRGDDVAAVGEGEDGELDAELVADRRTHGDDGSR